MHIEIYKTLGDKLQKTLQDIITLYDVSNINSMNEIYNYYITDPILRHDYTFIADILNLIKFSSSEEKEYDIV